MPQDASFIFNNNQPVVNQNFQQTDQVSSTLGSASTPAINLPNPASSPLPSQGSTAINPNPAGLTNTKPQTLPDISSFTNTANSPDLTLSPTDNAVDLQNPAPLNPLPDANEPVTVNNSLAAPVGSASQPTVATPVDTPNPDFRAMAENIVTNTQIELQSPINTIPTVLNSSPIFSPTPAPNLTIPTDSNLQSTNQNTNTNSDTSTTPVKLPDPMLQSDPFIQEIHDQDVKVERDALEVLIASNRIDPELKEHLKIELLKFKDLENDITPIGQDINSIAAEVMAPEPATPVVNPIQAIPPQPPM